MKKIYLYLLGLILLASCQESYDFDPGFTVPTTFEGPSAVQIDLTSSQNLVFKWEGGGANDGGIVLYSVLFDVAGGNFSDPVYTMTSDLGAHPQVTLNHVTLNKIARLAGLKTGETKELKWTVTASKGGVLKQAEGNGTVTITRPSEEIPERMYLTGTATENGGTDQREFRQVSDGVFVIFTNLSAGNLLFADALTEDAVHYTMGDNNRLAEGTTPFTVTAYDTPVRLTVNFNTKEMKTEKISGVRMIWGATFGVIAQMNYQGGGIFKADDVYVLFVDQSRPETNPPGWLSWTEERYYFIATIEGSDYCWGRNDGISAERPSDNEPLRFYELGEFGWSQWDHLWKMSGKLDTKYCTVTIDTNLEGMMVHQFSNIR